MSEPQPQAHLTPDRTRALFDGSLNAEETERLVRHLLSGCEWCRTLVRDGLESTGPRHSLPRTIYEGATVAVLAATTELTAPGARSPRELLAEERIAAPGLAAMLLENQPFERQVQLVTEEARFQTWALAEHLTEESRASIWSAHPKQVTALARLALEVVRQLDPERYGESLLADLEARCRGSLGNAYRNQAEFEHARAELRIAAERLREGSGDLVEEAELVSLEGSLLTDQGYFEEAVELLERLLAVARRIEDPILEARGLIQQALARGYAGDPHRAVELLEVAEDMVDRTIELRLFFCARHSRIHFLLEEGEVHRAVMLYERSRSLYQQFRDSWTQLRRRWLEARLAVGLGQIEEAEAALGSLWTTAFTRGLRLEVALISLDLASVYVRLGKHAEAWRLAGRLIPLFRNWGVHRRALEAWALLQHSFSAQTATQELIGRVAAYLRRGWRNPEIPLQLH